MGDVRPPSGLDGFISRPLRDGKHFWFREAGLWQYWVQPRDGAPTVPPLAVIAQSSTRYYQQPLVKPLPPDGLEGFTKWKENGPPNRTYWHKRIDGWEYFVFRGDEGATAAPLVIHDRGSAMGDGVTNFGYYPSMNQQTPNTFVTNDEALGRIAMGGDGDEADDTSEGSEEPGGLLDGWFSTNYVVKSPITISIAFAIVLILGYFAGRRNRAD